MNNKFISILEKLLIVYIVSLLFFSIIDVAYVLYCITAIAICFLLRVKYNTNLAEMCTMSSIVLSASALGYLTATHIVNKTKIAFDCINIFSTCLLIVIFIAFLVSAYRPKEIIASIKEVLFEQQKYDVKRVVEYIEQFDIVGINGIWGNGKTFITNYIKEFSDISDRYIFVTIDLLSCNLEQVHSIIFDSIGRVLDKQRVFSKNAKTTKKLLSNTSVIDNIYSTLINDEISYSDSLAVLKQELNNLEKNIIIVYEDIDRITEVDTIKKIFSISEQLVCNKIKILYQYEDDSLVNLGFKRKYIEKYIPYIVNLTPIPLFSIIKFFLGQNICDTESLSEEDFQFLNMYSYIVVDGVKLNVALSQSGYSIRKAKHFLLELASAIKNNEEYALKENKKTVIVFYLIKHFFFDIYKELDIAARALDTVTVKYNENKYSFPSLISYCTKNNLDKNDVFAIMLNSQENADILFLLHHLGYKIEIPIQRIPEDNDSIYDEDFRTLSAIHTNDKADRLIWNLLCNGKSEYTNIENAARKFINEVLNVSREQQGQAYNEFWDDMFNGRLYKEDNTTIFKFGLSPMLSMFKAFYILNFEANTWIKLIDFYFCNRIKEIDNDVIASLKCCRLRFSKVYLHSIRKFNNLNVVGNFNNKKHYVKFLLEYLQPIAGARYLNSHDLWKIDGLDTVNDNKDAFVTLLDAYIRQLNDLRGSIPLEKIKDDLDAIIAFLKKNKEIIIYKEAAKDKPFFQTTYHTNERNQEYDRLLEMQETPNFVEQVEESYYMDKIGIRAVVKLLAEDDDTTSSKK